MTHSALASRYASALVDVATGPTSGVDPHQVLRDLRGFAEVLHRFGGVAQRPDFALRAARPQARRGRTHRRKAGRLAHRAQFLVRAQRIIAASRCSPKSWKLSSCSWTSGWVFTRAEISSARELDQRQRDAVARSSSASPARKMRMRFAVDGGLLGGLVARIGSTVYDGSVRGQLQALGKRLASGMMHHDAQMTPQLTA